MYIYIYIYIIYIYVTYIYIYIYNYTFDNLLLIGFVIFINTFIDLISCIYYNSITITFLFKLLFYGSR